MLLKYLNFKASRPSPFLRIIQISSLSFRTDLVRRQNIGRVFWVDLDENPAYTAGVWVC